MLQSFRLAGYGEFGMFSATSFLLFEVADKGPYDSLARIHVQKTDKQR